VGILILRRNLARGFVAGLLTLLFSGCGDSDTSSPSDTIASPPAGPTQSQTPATAGSGGKFFEGELLGIYLGRPDVLAEKGILMALADVCPSGVKVVEDDSSIPRAPPYLPPGSAEPTTVQDAFFIEQPNPGAALCTDTLEPYRSWRQFELPVTRSDLPVPFLRLNAVFLERAAHGIVVPPERVRVANLSGREVILLEPFATAAADRGNYGEILIPTDYGFLRVVETGVAWDETIKVAESLIPLLPTFEPMEALSQ
jgi:hypothetical protein